MHVGSCRNQSKKHCHSSHVRLIYSEAAIGSATIVTSKKCSLDTWRIDRFGSIIEILKCGGTPLEMVSWAARLAQTPL